MIVSVYAYGSRGDIQPAIALAEALARRGHETRLIAPPSYAAHCEGRGFELRPLSIDLRPDLESPEGRRLLTSGGPTLGHARWALEVTRRHFLAMAPEALEHARGSDVVVGAGVLDPFATLVARALNIPCVHAWLSPSLPTTDYMCPIGLQVPRLPGLANALGYAAISQLAWSLLRPIAKEIAKSYGDAAPPISWRATRGDRLGEPILHAYSEALAARPSHWPAAAEVTGFWFLEPKGDWKPPADLAAFMEAGPAPLYVGFGTNVPEKAIPVLEKAIAALSARKIRTVMKLEPGMDPAILPDHIKQVGVVPFEWLFPRVSAAIHHGGAGTASAALRAGKPSLAIPFMADQFFWADRLRAQRLSPSVAPRKSLTVAGLGAAIDTLLGDPELHRRTQAAAAVVRAEPGVHRAAEIIDEVARGRRFG